MIRTSVDLDAVRGAARACCFWRMGCEAVAVLFRQCLCQPGKRAALPWRRFGRSGPTRMCRPRHEILPEIREFERFSTTALNAYLQPEVSGYLSRS